MTRPNLSPKSALRLLVLALIPFACSDNGKNVSHNSVPVVSNDSILLWIEQSTAQDVHTEEKRQLLQRALDNSSDIQNDSLKSAYFSKLSSAFKDLGDSLQFREINKTTMLLAKKTKDSLTLFAAHDDLASFFRANSVMDSAYFHYAKAQKGYDALKNDFLSALMLYNIGKIQADIGDYTASEITTVRAIEKFKPIKSFENLYRCYKNLGDVAKHHQDYTASLKYYDQADEYIELGNLGILEQIANKNNIGLVFQDQGQHQTAVTYFMEVAEHDSLQEKWPKLYARALNNLGQSMLKSGSMKKLPNPFFEAITIQKDIGDIAGQSSSTYNLAEYNLLKGDSTRAKNNFEKAKALAKQSDNNKRCLQTLLMLARVDPKNVLGYTEQYVTLRDDMQNQERQLRDKFARIRFETNEVVAQNELLARQRQLWSGIAAALLLLGGASFIIFNQRVKNQKLRFQQAQQASNQEIFNLMLAQSEKLEEGKQIEQKRISEELHDGVQGRLQGARMMLLGLNNRSDENAVSERKRAIAMLKEIQEEVRSISHELSHAAYQKIHNFILSLEDLIATTRKGVNIDIDFGYADQLDWDALSGDVKINLYRVIQETIQNSVKHGECKKISLDLSADASTIKVTIGDDGKGFSKKKGRRGIGMRNIASRMKKINGTWDIETAPGKGTLVTFVIPINLDGDSPVNVYKEEQNLQEI